MKVKFGKIYTQLPADQLEILQKIQTSSMANSQPITKIQSTIELKGKQDIIDAIKANAKEFEGINKYI